MSFLRCLSRLFVLFVVAFIFTGCSAVFTKMYGLKNLKPVDEQTVLNYAKKYSIPSENVFELDTAYFSFLSSLDDSRYSEQRQNHYQPLQALYYNGMGELTSFQINCYSGGFPNLKWNRGGAFEVFPPLQQAPVDSILPLSLHTTFFRPVAATKQYIPEQYDFFVVVYWSRAMGRQSKRLIRIVNKNLKLAEGLKVHAIYVNTDDFFNKTR